MPITARTRTITGHPWPSSPPYRLVAGDVAGDMAGDMDDLRLLDLLGDGQALDPSRPVELPVLLHGGVLFQGAAAPTLQRGAGPAVLDLPRTAARPDGGPAIDAIAAEANSSGPTGPARRSAPAQPAPPL